MVSLYPGYEASGTFGQVIIGTLNGFIDGAICGVLFAWLYNTFAATKRGVDGSSGRGRCGTRSTSSWSIIITSGIIRA